ncbi:MAG: DUF2155 domain-containing protein [Rhodospirillales bacterium]
MPIGKTRLARAALLTLAFCSPGGGARADSYPIVLLRALDKVTTRSSTLEAPIDQPVHFRTLTITARVCDKKPPEEQPEAAAFLDIVEARPGMAARDVFRGWMFASSPGLSPMQHPVYDVWVLDCIMTDDTAAARDSTSGADKN